MKTEQFSGKAYLSSPAFDRLVVDQLSVRAQNALKHMNVRSASELKQLDSEDVFAVRHCGKKTAQEIMGFRNAIRNGKYDLSVDDIDILADPEWLPEGEEALALNAVSKGLSSRGQTTLQRFGVERVSDFMHMSLIDIPHERGTGEVTVSELYRMKDILMGFIRIAHSIPKSERLNALCGHIFNGFVSDKEDWHLDPDTPYESLRTWVATSSRGIKKVERSVLMRLGLAGDRAMTLEKTGSVLGLTRERVRQLNKEFKIFAEWIVAQRRLDPLIENMAGIVDSERGSILKVELLRRLARKEGTQEELGNASRLIDFISDFEPWLRRGLSCDKRYVMRA